MPNTQLYTQAIRLMCQYYTSMHFHQICVKCFPDIGKIKLEHELIFGTGDHWQAPILTTNMGFVREITHTS